MVLNKDPDMTYHWLSIPVLFLFVLLVSSFIILPLYFLGSSPSLLTLNHAPESARNIANGREVEHTVKVYVADLPRELNYGLLENYWSDRKQRKTLLQGEEEAEFSGPSEGDLMPYPQNPLWRQYSAEYWLLADLMTSPRLRKLSISKRVLNPLQADVIFVPFFATLSAELQLGTSRKRFRHQTGNEDYKRQREVVDLVKNSSLWHASGGKDHVFVLTDPVAMWHVRQEIASSIFLVVDFGGWYKEDSNVTTEGHDHVDLIQHTQVSLIKDIIIPYTHLIPLLHISQNSARSTLLYFRGARHRHRTGLVREKLWKILGGQPGVILEEGFPNKEGQIQALKAMRSSEFCLHPAGDTPTSCRLYDAIASLCIPVIVSDSIELPFEGMIDYQEFSLFISVQEALQPMRLIQLLQNVSSEQRNEMRQHLSDVQHHFEFENSFLGGRGPVIEDGAVNLIWKKILQKVPQIRESIIRHKRIPRGASSTPVRCHCT